MNAEHEPKMTHLHGLLRGGSLLARGFSIDEEKIRFACPGFSILERTETEFLLKKDIDAKMSN